MVRGPWFVVRGSWFVVRGPWFVVRGSWFVVRARARAPLLHCERFLPRAGQWQSVALPLVRAQGRAFGAAGRGKEWETGDLRLETCGDMRQRDIETGRDSETLRLWRPCGRAIDIAFSARESALASRSRHRSRCLMSPQPVSGLWSHVHTQVPASPVADQAAGVPLPRGEDRAAARPPARVVPVGECGRAGARPLPWRRNRREVRTIKALYRYSLRDSGLR